MRKETTLTVWTVNFIYGTEVHPTRRAARAAIERYEQHNGTCNQTPEKRTIYLGGRTLADAFFAGVTFGQAHGCDE